jgi:hypothetical protein
MKRRDFLKQSAATVGAAAALSSTGPYILGADDKAGAKKAIVGSGEHTYECNHDWCKLPEGWVWQTTHGVCVDGEGLVYIKQQGHGGKPAVDTVAVFEPNGTFVRSFGKGIHPGGHGIDLRKEGSEEFLYLCDTAHGEVLKTSLKGDIVWKLGFPKEAMAQPSETQAPSSSVSDTNLYSKTKAYRPTNLAFAPDGGFYVADGYGQNYIHQYDKDRKWVRTWGGAGKEPGKMNTPHGIWLDNRPGRDVSLVVADRANSRLQYFTLEGKHIGFVEGLPFPAHFDIRGKVLLVPDLHARVTLLDGDNKPIAQLGYDPAWTEEVKKFKIRGDEKLWKAGKFVHPHDACFDRDGNIFVTEWVETGRVSLLKKV